MSPERMEHLLQLVAPLITKQDTNYRKAIPPADRLMVTLRYLASGNSQVSLSYLFLMGKKTISRIVSETSRAIYLALQDPYFTAPKSPEQWKMISAEFSDLWQFPHVIGAIDGKHVRIKAPKRSGTNYHNYKGYFSIQLLAVCDAKYKFIFADVGQYGSNNDCAVLNNSKIGEGLERGTLSIPSDEKIPGIDGLDMPYYLLGDEIFPLEPYLMRPYPGTQPEPGQVFNYRQSRARLPIENSFGILVARWRIFECPIQTNQDNAKSFVMACLCLHNYLRMTENSLYTPYGFIDVATKGGEIKPGDWRRHEVTNGAIVPIKKLRGRRNKDHAKKVRDSLKDYFNQVNVLPWQLAKVRTVGTTVASDSDSDSD